MIYCTNCGKAIPKESRFCTFCGATVPVVDPEKPNIAQPSPATPPNIASSTPGPNYTQNTYLTSTEHRKLEFFKNPGFYGGLLAVIGFFLPWFLFVTAESGFDMLQRSLDMGTGVYIFIAILIVMPAIGGLVVVVNSLTGALSSISGLFKWLAFLSIVMFLALLVIGSRENNNSFINFSDAESIISVIGLGLWLTVGGCLIMLFNKRVKL